MLNGGNVLHFINRMDSSNCGDRVVCPFLHYYDYFKQYSVKRHDIRFIDFESIACTDVVIIGGGGLFDYAEFTNRNVNKVLDTGAAVIAWSPGFNMHAEYSGTFTTEIDFDRFATVTVRDFTNGYGLYYLPDVTCKLPGLRGKYIIRRELGIARHKDYPIEGFDYDIITNESEIAEVLQFIGESEIIISNSFHMIYWATLMRKRAICVNPFSSRFYSYKYKPEYFYADTDTLSACINRAETYNMLDECIQANDTFFERVKDVIESRLEPVSSDFAVYDFTTKEALLTAKVRENQLQKGDVLASQLFIDLGSGFTENCKLITINNVYGDDIHLVRYDLADFDEIRALRFDPIERHHCEVEIVSAKTADVDVALVAQMSIRTGNWDRFLTTDPHYDIGSPCVKFLEIKFRLRELSLFEAEQNINFHVSQQSKQIEHQAVQIEHQVAQIERQTAQIENQTAQIENQAAEIEQFYNSISWKVTAPLRKIADFFRHLLKGIRRLK
jgi:hypothetical protein